MKKFNDSWGGYSMDFAFMALFAEIINATLEITETPMYSYDKAFDSLKSNGFDIVGLRSLSINDGNFTFANQKFCKLVALVPRPVQVPNYLKVFHPRDLLTKSALFGIFALFTIIMSLFGMLHSGKILLLDYFLFNWALLLGISINMSKSK